MGSRYEGVPERVGTDRLVYPGTAGHPGHDPSGTVASGDRSVLYANRVLRTWLKIQMHNKPNMLLTLENWDGRPVMQYCGIPIKTVDQLVSSEARVV